MKNVLTIVLLILILSSCTNELHKSTGSESSVVIPGVIAYVTGTWGQIFDDNVKISVPVTRIAHYEKSTFHAGEYYAFYQDFTGGELIDDFRITCDPSGTSNKSFEGYFRFKFKAKKTVFPVDGTFYGTSDSNQVSITIPVIIDTSEGRVKATPIRTTFHITGTCYQYTNQPRSSYNTDGSDGYFISEQWKIQTKYYYQLEVCCWGRGYFNS